MTDRKLMQLALEALKEIHPGSMTPMAEQAWNKAITSLRQAIAEAKQAQPVAWRNKIFASKTSYMWNYTEGKLQDSAGEDLVNYEPLFTFPPSSWLEIDLVNAHWEVECNARIREEREVCASLCLINAKDAPTDKERDMALACAAAIRARGQIDAATSAADSR